jgi:K+-sensing histidine kinase KdpD
MLDIIRLSRGLMRRRLPSLARSSLDLHRIRSPILRYGLAVVSVAIAFGISIAVQHLQFRDVELALFTLAIAITTWYAGNGPSVLAILLSTTTFNYFFTEPFYSLWISARDLPYFITFAVWGIVVALFAAVRRAIEENLSQAHQELAERAAQLEAANKELESFTYSVSHDLRAPLRHVAGFAELLQKQSAETLDEKGRRYTAMILEAAKRMGDLIDDLLGFCRIGRAEARMTTVRLDQLVREAIAELGQYTKDREISWTIGQLPVCFGDRPMLKVAFTNLLSNAIKFTRHRPRAEIEIGSVDRNGNQVEVFVRDNGAGFDMQYVDKLFGVFQRLHRAEEFEGTGIGLATVQRIIHRHGGQVRAQGKVDQGATFYLTLSRA